MVTAVVVLTKALESGFLSSNLQHKIKYTHSFISVAKHKKEILMQIYSMVTWQGLGRTAISLTIETF